MSLIFPPDSSLKPFPLWAYECSCSPARLQAAASLSHNYMCRLLVTMKIWLDPYYACVLAYDYFASFIFLILFLYWILFVVHFQLCAFQGEWSYVKIFWHHWRKQHLKSCRQCKTSATGLWGSSGGRGLMIWEVKAPISRLYKSKLTARLLEVSCLNIQHLKRWSCRFWHFKQKVFALILLDAIFDLFRMASLAQAWDGCWNGKQIRRPEEGSSLMRWAWAKPCRPSRCFWQAAQLFGGDVWASDCDQGPKSLRWKISLASRWMLLFFLFRVAGLSSVCSLGPEHMETHSSHPSASLKNLWKASWHKYGLEPCQLGVRGRDESLKKLII